VEENTVEIIESPEEETKLKTCFVITPIGDENSFIRRHIDGVINAAIRPALANKYDVKVAHEFSSTGSINNQVIIEIYNSDLVIANLTELNPNVMYELAIRHALKKPVIMIMEKGDTNLPFDVASERTIFYKNDFQGVLDLKREIINTEKNIEKNKNVSNPIYDALYDYTSDKSLIKKVESQNIEDASVFKSILNKINNLEKSIYNANSEAAFTKSYNSMHIELNLIYDDEIDSDERQKINRFIKPELKKHLQALLDNDIKILGVNDPEKIELLIRNTGNDFSSKRIVSNIFDIFEIITEDNDIAVKLDNLRIKDI